MLNRHTVATTVIAVIVTAALCACSNPGTIEQLENGGLQIDCSGGYHTWSGCHDRAKRACGDEGFDIVSQTSNEGSSSVGSKDWSAPGSIVTRIMVVECRQPTT